MTRPAPKVDVDLAPATAAASNPSPSTTVTSGHIDASSNVAPLRRPDESKQRLVVELSAANNSLLQDLTELEGINKTNIVNRAIHLYSILRKAEWEGAEIRLHRPDDPAPQRIWII